MDSVGEGEGGKMWENGIETCICTAESLCCSSKTITTLFVNQLYPNIK